MNFVILFVYLTTWVWFIGNANVTNRTKTHWITVVICAFWPVIVPVSLAVDGYRLWRYK